MLFGLAIALAPAAPAAAQNLLLNGDFDEAPAVGWQCAPPSGCSHDGADVDGAPGSGSALLVTGAAASDAVALEQCIDVAPASDYDFAASGLVEAANPVATILRIRMTWYQGPACTGSLIYGEVLANAGETGVWTPLTRARPSPPDAASGRFTVQFLKSPSATGVAAARVDAVSVPEAVPGMGAGAALATCAGLAAARRARRSPLNRARRRPGSATGDSTASNRDSGMGRMLSGSR